MTISISKDEVRDVVKLKIMVELNNAKTRVDLLEAKYQKSFNDFEKWMKNSEENFEVWDDYLEWKAYQRLVKDLMQELSDVEHAQDIQLT